MTLTCDHKIDLIIFRPHHVKLIGGSCRVLLVAFGFFPQVLGGDGDLPMVLLSFYECRLSGGDTQKWWEQSNPTCCN